MRNFERYHFKEVSNKEQIISVIHRHWFDILRQFFALIVFVVILIGGFFISPTIAPLLDDRNYYQLFLLLESTLFIFVILSATFIWIDYYFDLWIITNKRIIDIEQKALFNRHVSELKIDRIQDVTVEVTGFISTMLNFGNVHVQTAGEKDRFVFKMIANPYAVKDLIMSIQRRNRAKEVNELGEVIRKQIERDHS